MTEKVREHANGEHPLFDCAECPVCEWMLEQHDQGGTA
jgi:hypothetical protein